jgi:hypothetical protein
MFELLPGRKGNLKRVSALTVLLAFSIVSPQAQAQALTLHLSGKKGGHVQVPLNEKLEEGTGLNTSTAEDLRPLTLNAPQESAGEVKDGSVIQLNATKSGYVPKDPLAGDNPDGVLPTMSIKPEAQDKAEGKAAKANVNKSTFETAKEVSAMPLALMPSEDESQKKVEFIAQNDNKQLSDLWDSCLNRNQDIQFVVNKLVPTSDKTHATTILTRTLSTLLFGAIGSMQMIAPGTGTYAAQQFAGAALSQLTGVMDSKQQKKMQLNQAELIMLYGMVRQTADKLSDNFRMYKDSNRELQEATTSFEEIRNMIKDNNALQNAASQLMVHIAVKQAESNIYSKTSAVSRYRQSLVDLAGLDAVAKLEKQIQEEQHNFGENFSTTSLAGTSKPNM